MSMPPISSANPFIGIATKVGSYAGVGILLGMFVVGVAVSPVAFNAIDSSDRDWGRLSNIGQAYGSISAVLSAAALCLVVLMQRRQLRHERVTMVRDMHLKVVGIALDEPGYCQCWGARVSEEDERPFYYTNMILMLWWYSFEIGDLRDEQVRNYARSMFDSEVPRDYWRMHGQWRLSGAQGRQRRFLLMVDEAFRAAEASGPPARRRERPHRSPQPGAAPRGTRRLAARTAFGGQRRRLL